MSDSYDEWMRDHHSKFSTPTAVVDDVVHRVTRCPVVGRERILRGEANEVYAVDLDDGESVIVRIRHYDIGGFARAENFIALAKEAGVPAPETIAIEAVSIDAGEREFCIQRRMPGKPLDDLRGELSDDEIRAIVRQAGELLGRLHSVECEEHIRAAVWEVRTTARVEEIRAAATKAGADLAVIERAFEVAAYVRERYRQGVPRLVHADYGTKHFMVDNGRVSGIPDWDNSGGGHPVVDLAWWDMFYNSPLHPTSLLIEGYTSVRELPDDHEVLRIATGLHAACGFIPYYLSVGNERAAANRVKHISGLLKKWDALAT